MKYATVVILALVLVLSAPVFAGEIEVAKRYGVKNGTPSVSANEGVLPGQFQGIKFLVPGIFTDMVQVRELGPSFVNVEKPDGGIMAQVKELGPSFVNVEKPDGGITAQVKELGPSFVNVEKGGDGGITVQVKELGPSFINPEPGGDGGSTAKVKK